MELNVWFDGQPRTVCNVTGDTTCHDVIMAIARTAGLPGRYTLLLATGRGDRPLVPNESVTSALIAAPQGAQLVLQRTDLTGQQQQQMQQQHQQQLQLHQHQQSRARQQQQQLLRPVSVHTNGSGSSNCSTSSTDQEASEAARRKLKDQLLVQEHEIEMNRLKIEELDKELRLLQLSCQSSATLEQRLQQQEAELRQLDQASLADHLARERQLHDRLQSERRLWDKRLTDVNIRLAELHANAQSLQQQVVNIGGEQQQPLFL